MSCTPIATVFSQCPSDNRRHVPRVTRLTLPSCRNAIGIVGRKGRNNPLTRVSHDVGRYNRYAMRQAQQ
jgi:hypothetical protein